MKYVNIHKASGAEPGMWFVLSKRHWYYYVIIMCYYCYFPSALNVSGPLWAAPSLCTHLETKLSTLLNPSLNQIEFQKF